MGDRAQIAVKMGGTKRVYLYSHWSGSHINKVLAEALEFGKPRWDDECYLTRIIFNRITAGHEFDETCFGIDCSLHGDIEHPCPVLDCASQSITWCGPRARNETPCTFTEFITRFRTSPAGGGAYNTGSQGADTLIGMRNTPA